jgi:hypothetical protein
VTAPLHLDGTPAAYPPDQAAAALAGQWRWLLTDTRLRGATTGFIDPLSDLVVPRPGTGVIDIDLDRAHGFMEADINLAVLLGGNEVKL